MKICVTSQGEGLDAAVDPRFGRAAKFVIVDSETMEANTVDNGQNLQAMQGAGIQAAQNVAAAGAKTVLTGHCGPKAFHALKAAGIEVCLGASGTVRQAVEDFKSGKIKKGSGPDKEGHWG